MSEIDADTLRVGWQRGTALLEVLIVGFAVVLMVLPVFSIVARLSEANGVVHAVARDTAVWVARHGSSPPNSGGGGGGVGIGVRVVQSGNVVAVVASQEVELVGVGGSSVYWRVQSRVEIPVSAYRSRP